MKYFVFIFAVIRGPDYAYIEPHPVAHLPSFSHDYECDDWIEAYNKLNFWPGGEPNEHNVLRAYCIPTEAH